MNTDGGRKGRLHKLQVEAAIEAARGAVTVPMGVQSVTRIPSGGQFRIEPRREDYGDAPFRYRFQRFSVPAFLGGLFLIMRVRFGTRDVLLRPTRADDLGPEQFEPSDEIVEGIEGSWRVEGENISSDAHVFYGAFLLAPVSLPVGS